MEINNAITEQHQEQYRDDGFFILESVIPATHLNLPWSTCSNAIADMTRK